MGGENKGAQGPDLTLGVPASDIPTGGVLAGHVGDDAVLLARAGGAFVAIGASCTHYGAPLADGIVVGDTIRCPWHHAAFSLRDGRCLRPPALNDLPRWHAEERDGRVWVAARIDAEASTSAGVPARNLERVVIVGAGAAGIVAADTLRREGFSGAITILDGDVDAPVDRPNLSKDYLAGNAPEDWIPLRPAEYFTERELDLVRGARAVAVDLSARTVNLDDGSLRRFDALLLATGASPVRLPIEPAGALQVRYLRTLADSRDIIAAASQSRVAVVIGASFIGLEVAASLRARGLEVHVVAPETHPLERVLGAELGDAIRAIHEAHGVVFHLGRTVKALANEQAILDNGDRLRADLVVAGVGVRPNVSLAEDAGLAVDKGILVNEFLETQAPGVYAAGDCARWLDPATGEHTRIEHWVLAERQGQTAARNILGRREPFTAIPFFWSAHYEMTIRYVGHAERWDAITIDGDPAQHDCRVEYRAGEHILAVATIGRDRDALEAEARLERERLPNATAGIAR